MRIADRMGALALLGGLALGGAGLPTAALACDGSAQAALAARAERTQDEARAQFREADTDTSGTISPEEWRNWREQTSASATEGPGGPPSPAGYDGGEALAGKP